ncbi:hypothetical protein SAMN05421787_101804 [Virgibacillus pantothenticus]|nr:hypothetical protein SAMN05421787_101804 [Virgibacillus pantothenticus]
MITLSMTTKNANEGLTEQLAKIKMEYDFRCEAINTH